MKQRLKKRRCEHCGELFIPSPYNAYHQLSALISNVRKTLISNVPGFSSESSSFAA